MGKIAFFYEETNFILPKTTRIKAWLRRIIQTEGFDIEQINFIFCSDTYLHKLNLEYLEHDTYTDIITFDYSTAKLLEGDLYISVDRVNENALELHIDFNDEINRVMAHGILHMMGFKDKSIVEKKEMRLKEESCLSLLLAN